MENNEEQKNTGEMKSIEQVLEKIRTEEITPHSKSYFNLRITAIVVLLVVVLLLSIFLASFIFYGARITGQFSLFGLGKPGWAMFLVLFPWKLALLDLLFVIILGFLVRTFRFGYKSPLLYMLVCIFVLMLGFGFAVDRGTPLHAKLMHETEQNRFRPVGPLYDTFRHPPQPPPGKHIYRGVIVEVSDKLLVDLDNPDGDDSVIYEVQLPGFDFTTAPFDEGDLVFIEGTVRDKVIFGQAIKVIMKN